MNNDLISFKLTHKRIYRSGDFQLFYETGISKTDRVEQTAQTISNLIIGNDDYQAFYMEMLRMDNIEVTKDINNEIGFVNRTVT